jgi:zinc transporter ZupT
MLTIAATTPVHTTGVNWQSVLAITASIVTLLSILGAVVGRYIASKITSSISKFQDAVVDKLDTRLTIVETKLDTLNRNNP